MVPAPLDVDGDEVVGEAEEPLGDVDAEAPVHGLDRQLRQPQQELVVAPPPRGGVGGGVEEDEEQRSV